MLLKQERSELNSDLDIRIYIDFDPKNQIFYHNFFFEDFNVVLKIALTSSLNGNENHWNDVLNKRKNLDLKLEKFDFTKFVYLLHYD